jgi:hypothetical protein
MNEIRMAADTLTYFDSGVMKPQQRRRECDYAFELEEHAAAAAS